MSVLKPTLAPGRYLVQDMSASRSFITTDEAFSTDPSKQYEPVVVLPPGVLASVVSLYDCFPNTSKASTDLGA